MNAIELTKGNAQLEYLSNPKENHERMGLRYLHQCNKMARKKWYLPQSENSYARKANTKLTSLKKRSQYVAYATGKVFLSKTFLFI